MQTWGTELERLAQIADAPEIAFRLASPEISQEARIEAMAENRRAARSKFPAALVRGGVGAPRADRRSDAVSQSYQDLLDRAARTRARDADFRDSSPNDVTVQRVVSGSKRWLHKKIIPTVKVDPALLGGVMAELGGKIYDGSLATRLAKQQRRLVGELGQIKATREGHRTAHGGNSDLQKSAKSSRTKSRASRAVSPCAKPAACSHAATASRASTACRTRRRRAARISALDHGHGPQPRRG